MRVPMSGIVVNDDDARIYKYFGYSVICPADVRRALKENPQGETLTLEINSCGGSVFAGFEIYTVLRGSFVRTVAEVQSLAASAASTLMLGCDEILMSPVAQVMIHDPMTYTDGNIQAHQESLQCLDSILESILNAYEEKCRGHRTREELRTMMAESTWMSAQSAVEAGLADRILWAEEPPVPQNILNAVGSGIRALAGSGGLPDVQQLRAQYEQIQRAAAPAPEDPAPEPPDDTASTGTPPAEDSQDWRDQARLDLERIRF